MDALRHSLLAPATGSFILVLGCVGSLKEMVKHRYAAKDDNGKPIFPHPYKPWEEDKIDEKHKDAADLAYRSFKCWENVKEWTFMSFPTMWIYSIYGPTLPFVTQPMVDACVILSSLVYYYANDQYTKGYCESPEKRLKGFYLRTNVCKFWMFGAGLSLGWSILDRFGVIDIVSKLIFK